MVILPTNYSSFVFANLLITILLLYQLNYIDLKIIITFRITNLLIMRSSLHQLNHFTKIPPSSCLVQKVQIEKELLYLPTHNKLFDKFISSNCKMHYAHSTFMSIFKQQIYGIMCQNVNT